MAAQPGRLWALFISNGTTLIPVAGLQTRSFSLDNTNVDVTTADSAGRWRELLGGAGIQSLEIQAGGKYQSDAGAKLAMQACMTSVITVCRLVVPGVQFDGSFLVDKYKSDGPYSEATTFELTLQSSGLITATFS